MQNIKNLTKSLGVFQIVMINIIAVDSIRTLPFAASFGFSLVFYYLLIGVCFFIPSALVVAELGTGWPRTGGIYVWVREAFGKKWSLVCIWLNWIYNIVWYPTIVALISGTAAYLFNPDFEENKIYMAVSVIVIFWIATLVNLFGMKISSLVSTIGACIGTLLPMLVIALLGFYWYVKGNPLAIKIDASSFLPKMSFDSNLALLTNIIFGLMGLEMVATHGSEIRNPARDYPKAVFISALIILFTIIISSLAIALVVPESSLNLATGVMQAFLLFLDAINASWALNIVALFIIIGGICGISAWIIGPSKGIMVASKDGILPKFLSKKNKHDVPVNVLLVQAVIVTILSLSFILFPTVNSSYWLLSAITAQLSILVYIILFATAIRLHHKRRDVKRSFSVPGKKIGMWVVSGLGSFTCMIIFALGFVPPSIIPSDVITNYPLTLLLGIILVVCIPFLLLRFFKEKKTGNLF